MDKEVSQMKIMKPITSHDIDHDTDFIYEVKYDGFRALLFWEKDHIKLMSKQNKDLTTQFPEIVAECLHKQDLVASELPIILDGEIVILNHDFQANFALIQKRGRLKNKERIQQQAKQRPATFIAFDMLQKAGVNLTSKRLETRKKALTDFFQQMKIGNSVSEKLRIIQTYTDIKELKKIVFNYQSEGIIAKRKGSAYHPAKQHHDWFKLKNWRIIHGILTHFNTHNGYFTVSVLHEDQLIHIGKCKHGLDDASMHVLKQLFMTHGTKTQDGYQLPPAICASIRTLDLIQGELREPEFANILPNMSPQDCTLDQLKLKLAMIPQAIEPTNTSKVFWPDDGFTKGDLLIYLRHIAPYMLPFLKNKALTLIRYPDGITEEGFFQKSLPAYAPSFIQTYELNDKQVFVCDELESLLWFANHGAIEFHIPFQTIHAQNHPTDIVFDLDPPDREHFHLAVVAALLIKQILDELNIIAFVKTSGNKGLQIHIPITKETLTYHDTALFTQAIAFTIEKQYPHLFTTERLKKNRQGRLYIDYVQHGKDKTIIAPYSPRSTNEASVATPLFWEEVTEELRPEQFTIANVIERVQTLGCPFATYFEAGAKHSISNVLEFTSSN